MDYFLDLGTAYIKLVEECVWFILQKNECYEGDCAHCQCSCPGNGCIVNRVVIYLCYIVVISVLLAALFPLLVLGLCVYACIHCEMHLY